MQNISQLYAMIVNDFDKMFVLAFYNSFLKIKLISDKENMFILQEMRNSSKIRPLDFEKK